MRHHSLRVLFLSCFLGLTAGSGLLPLSSLQIAVQAAELGSQGSQDGVIKACTGQSINLGAPQLTEADLKVLTGCSSGVIPQLLESLKSRDWKVKVIAAHTLGLYGKQAQSVIPELSSLLQDENADVRFAVAQALGDIGTEAVVPVLAKALQDKDENVRVSAADAFLRIGAVAKPAKPVLIAALWDGNWYVRSRAAATISRLGLEVSDIPNLVAPLRNSPESDFGDDNGALVSLMLATYSPVRNKIEDLPFFFIAGTNHPDPKVRESAAVALGLISMDRSGELHMFDSANSLIKLSQDSDVRVRHRSVQALGSVLRGFANAYHVKFPRSVASRRFISSDREIAKIESTLLTAIQDRDAIVRKAAVESLKSFIEYQLNSPEKIILALILALQDREPSLRQSAAGSSKSFIDLSPKISSALVKSLSDENESVRQSAAETLKEKPEILLPALIEIIQNQSAKIEIRYSAMRALWSRSSLNVGSLDHNKSDKVVHLLTKLLQQEPDLIIRQQAAIALLTIDKDLLDSKIAVELFTIGLNSKDPILRFDAITGLQKVCPLKRKEEPYSQACLDAKTTLPLLINTLKDDIKPLRYSAALAISKIDTKEETEINVLREILLEEDIDQEIRNSAQRALSDIASSRANVAIIESSKFEDRKARYSRSCTYSGFFQTGYFPIDSKLFNRIIKEEVNLRFSCSTSASLAPLSALLSLLNDIQKDVNYPMLQNILKLKNQDQRRATVYALGVKYQFVPINFRSPNSRYPSSLESSEITNTIKELRQILDNKKDDLDVRWMAAASLQKLDIDVNQFFLENKLPNPKSVKCQFPIGGHIAGLSFDIYSSQCIVDGRIGCGDGLTEIYNALRRLLSK
jgi:HEAT repeat protein